MGLTDTPEDRLTGGTTKIPNNTVNRETSTTSSTASTGNGTLSAEKNDHNNTTKKT